MKGLGRFAILASGAIAVAGLLLGTLVWRGPAERRALVVSATVAMAVQLLTFVLVRLAAREQLLKAWGVAVVVRFATLLVYALVVVRMAGLPAAPALLGLATFFFVSTLMETRLLSV